MITYIRGILAEKALSHVVIDVQGVGYFIHISAHTHTQLDAFPLEETVRLFTYHHFREDKQSLHGFYDTFERSVFEQLLVVPGVGLSTARMIISGVTPREIVEAVSVQDEGCFKKVKGVGAKTAKMILVSLCSKLDGMLPQDTEGMAGVASGVQIRKQEAQEALVVLGFEKGKVRKVLDTIVRQDTDLGSEDMVKRALAIMA